jgi:hypothetical protein
MIEGREAVRRKALLVLGMHRGGTSLVSGLLVRLGVEAPRTLMPPDESNLLGYWESERIVECHERLLRAAGTSWDGWTPVDASLPDTAPFVDELAGLVAAEFGAAPVLVVKDPRMCRLVPFWIRASDAAGIAARAVLVVREPADVARSLGVREGFPPQLSLLLWLRHMLDAECTTRGLPRSVVGFDEVLADWRAVADRMAEDLDVGWPLAPEIAGDAVRAFVNTGLSHHHASSVDLDAGQPLDRWVAHAREAFARLRHVDPAERAEARATLDVVRAELDAASAVFGRGDEAARARVTRQLERAEADRRLLRAHAAALEADRDRLRAQADAAQQRAAGLELELAGVRQAADHERNRLDREAGQLRDRIQALHGELDSANRRQRDLLASWSWRVTAPLRATFDLLRQVAGRPNRPPEG